MPAQLRQQLLRAVAQSTDATIHSISIADPVMVKAFDEAESQQTLNAAVAAPYRCPDCTANPRDVTALFFHLLKCKDFRAVYKA